MGLLRIIMSQGSSQSVLQSQLFPLQLYILRYWNLSAVGKSDSLTVGKSVFQYTKIT